VLQTVDIDDDLVNAKVGLKRSILLDLRVPMEILGSVGN
jgi:hypothetical protein